MKHHEDFSWDHPTVNSKSLYIMSAIFFVAGIFAFILILMEQSKDYLTAVSVLFASVAALFASGAKFQADERDRAFRFLTENSNSKELMISLGFVGQVINKNSSIDNSTALAVYLSDDHRDKEFIKHVLNVYNFLEEMSIAIRNRQVNEKIIKQYYVGPFCRFVGYTKIFLPIFRNHPDKIPNHKYGEGQRPDAFVFAEWLHDRWLPYYLGYFEPPPLPHGTFEAQTWTG